MAEQKQKNGFVQFILFIVMSLIAFAGQTLIVTFGDNLLVMLGVSADAQIDAWIFGVQTLPVFIAFLVGNVFAKVVSYILNRKKTFGAVNNLVFSMTVYVIMCVVLIIVETVIGEPLGKFFANTIPDSIWSVLGTSQAKELATPDWSSTIAMIVYSTADFLIVFLMEKFVIMNDNLFKKAEKVETVEADAEEAEVEVAAEEAPVAEEPVVEEADAEEPVVEEADAEETEVEVAAEEAPVVEEKVEEPVVEEAEVEVATEEAPVVEEKAEEAPVVEEKVEEPVQEEAEEEVAAEEAPVAEEKVEEPVVEEAAPVVEEKVEEPAQEAAQKKMGKIEYRLGVDGYHFSIYASNGQLMYESQGFASLDTTKGGLETFKKALENSVSSVYQDKRKMWRFIINKRYVGEGYKTRAQAEKAIDSVKKFTALGTVVDYVEDPQKVKEYEAAKKALNKGKDVDWDAVLAIPAKTFGKFEINGREDRGFYFSLLANNGQLLYCSRYYASEDSCESAITTFKKAAYLNNFFFDEDKFGNFRFILKGTAAGIAYYGESYKTKDAAESSAESVRKFAASAKIVPFEPDADDEE